MVVDRETLQAMHRTEVIVKKWGAPIGNQYYQSLIPDISITICRNCNQVRGGRGVFVRGQSASMHVILIVCSLME